MVRFRRDGVRDRMRIRVALWISLGLGVRFEFVCEDEA